MQSVELKNKMLSKVAQRYYSNNVCKWVTIYFDTSNRTMQSVEMNNRLLLKLSLRDHSKKFIRDLQIMLLHLNYMTESFPFILLKYMSHYFVIKSLFYTYVQNCQYNIRSKLDHLKDCTKIFCFNVISSINCQII